MPGLVVTIAVKKGDFVNKGAVIAYSGSTGHSSGPHVHYETRINDVTVDPLTFEARGYRYSKWLYRLGRVEYLRLWQSCCRAQWTLHYLLRP